MKQALVVFESMFGNTGAVAEAVADGLRTGLAVEIVEVCSAPQVLGDEVDLLVVGGPTHALGLSRPGTRADAVKQGAPVGVAAETGLREWVDQVGRGSARPVVATFDTKVSRPRLPGSAARAAMSRLRRAGFRRLMPAENFYVDGTKGPLLDGELDRARNWGARCAARLADTLRDHRT